MTEAEAIGTLESAKKCCYGDKAEVFEEAFDMAIKALEEVQRYRAIGTVEGFERAIQSSIENYNLYREYKAKVQEVAKEYDWIPVTERLPEPFQRVLVFDASDNSITIEYLQENDSFIDSVVAWMPLPIAPYQKGE